MKKHLFTIAFILGVASTTANASDVRVLSKQTIGVDSSYDYKVRIFRICVGGLEFVQSMTFSPAKGTVDSHFVQVYKDGMGKSVPKTC